jgi:ABC-type transport system involved in multi-copper enzyme maturation permease subunit
LIIAAFGAGAARYNLHRSHYEASVSQSLRQLEGNTDWNSVGEAKAFLPPQPLATLVSGVSNDIGRTSIVRGRGEPVAQDSRYNEDPIYAVFRFLDLEFLFKVILSLFAIVLGYDAISGEKERGTLRLSFANAVPRATYILGKMTGSVIVLGVSLAIASAAGMLLLPLMGVPMAGGDWLRLGLILVTGFLYFGVFLTLSVCVSAMTQRSSNSFLILLVVWITSVLIIPRVSVLMAGRSVEVPSVDEIASQKATYATQLREEYLEGMANMSISMSEPDTDPMQALNAYMDSLHAARDSKMMAFSGRLNEDRRNRQATQSTLALSLARLSPTASLTLAISNLAGTSVGLKEQFYREALVYSGQFGDFKKEKTGFNTGQAVRVITHVDGEEPVEPERIDPSEMPAFKYVPSELASAVDAAAVDMGLLAIFNLIFFAGAFVAFARYDVR